MHSAGTRLGARGGASPFVTKVERPQQAPHILDERKRAPRGASWGPHPGALKGLLGRGSSSSLTGRRQQQQQQRQQLQQHQQQHQQQ